MYLPDTYTSALACMTGSMLCWGSWANTKKMASRYSFQLFYWDYCIGLLAASLLWGLTLGASGDGLPGLVDGIRSADSLHLAYAIIGGIIFNAANLLLVAAIEVAGLAVAFPVGIGLALIIGVLLNFLIAPQGSPLLLFGGLILIVAAIVVDAEAYRRREAVRARVSGRGLRLAIFSGVLMGLFYPFVAKALSGPGSLGPYSVNVVFSLGVVLCALVLNSIFMRRPLTGAPPVGFAAYGRAGAMDHLWGMLGGAVWSAGAMLSFIASGAHLVGPAVSYAIGQGATMISAVWGVFVWREFAGAPPGSRRLLPLMFALFLAGLAMIAFAPLTGR